MNSVDTFLDTLCERFHTTIDYLIPIYSHYMIQKDIIIIVMSILVIMACIAIMYLCYRQQKNRYGRNYELIDWDGMQLLCFILSAILIIIFVISIGCSIYDCILWNSNPEMRFLDAVLSHM